METESVELRPREAVCCTCGKVRGYLEPDATEFFCGRCARRGLIWAAKRAAMPWYRRLWPW